MQIELTLLLAPIKINNFLSRLDLGFGDQKHYVIELPMLFETDTPINDDYFDNMILQADSLNLDLDGHELLGIFFCNKLYAHPKVKQLSNGKNVMFIHQQ